MIFHFNMYPRAAFALAGTIAGAIIGLMCIGNFGVARAGSAFAVHGWAIGAIIGGYIGFRIGDWRLRTKDK
ncbi:hypothetical protein DXT94_05620 [Rhizobium sp. ICMP 5592]|nr:hypothetical protein [Rhizobium sp. ICMP 5592]